MMLISLNKASENYYYNWLHLFLHGSHILIPIISSFLMFCVRNLIIGGPEVILRLRSVTLILTLKKAPGLQHAFNSHFHVTPWSSFKPSCVLASLSSCPPHPEI